jgi:MscS family membrane protein
MSRLILVWLALGAMLLGGPQAAASDASGASPRAAMREFLTACRAGDYELAARYLDLGHLSPNRRDDEGPALARRLKAVLDRSLWIELEELSDAPGGRLEDGLPPDRERVGLIPRAQGSRRCPP